ncbi:MAG: hypothetical protein AB8A39_00130 [Prochlorococcus sp.]
MANFTHYQMQVIQNMTGLEPVRDVLTGELFIPQYEGQRTAINVSSEAGVEAVLRERYKNDPYYMATAADLDAHYAAESERTGIPQAATQAEYNQLTGGSNDSRLGRKVQEAMVQLTGGGANRFWRTASGLGDWQPMDADKKFIGDFDEAGNFISAYGVDEDIRHLTGLNMFGDEQEATNVGGFNDPFGGGFDEPGGETVDTSALDEVRSLHPWASDLGLIDMISDLVVDGASPDQIIVQVRASDPYKKQFPGMRSPDGTRRYATEAAYLSAIGEYREILKNFGAYDPATDTPMSYVAFMDAGIDPNELVDRFDMYRALEEGSDEMTDAFYVYAGMTVSVDDLFQATVSPQFRNELANEFDRQVANQPLDYVTFIDRAREMSTDAVVKAMETMQGNTALTGTAVSKVLAMDPEFGRYLMGALFNNSTDAAGTSTMTLDQLKHTFAAAVMGSAASEAGWEIPSLARIEEFRRAGIESSDLRAAYHNLSNKAPMLTGMVQRANRGSSFSQGLYEETLLGESSELGFALAAEEARGKGAGGFQTGQQGRRFTQPGRSLSY